ncbi:MAG: chemotaxis response regulator protein-glutamate methylesterase [Planctomycetes bacterium]|nr:chemotaxis response regulator protein-glutamate methylesterase [Planctomycetota bacterium]
MVRVLIVDDSALVRSVLTEILASDPEVEVVGAAADPYIARDMIKRLQPDVLTLDVEMPRMNGLTFLRNLMRLRPMPVVMISTLTVRGSMAALEALEIGAIDCVAKPQVTSARSMDDCAREILAKVRMAARAKVRGQAARRERGPRDRVAARSAAPLIAIGASTGGTEAIRVVLERVPADAPPIVIVQHIPAAFSGAFAARLDSVCAIEVVEACDGTELARGVAHVAPGGRHLEVAVTAGKLRTRLHDGPPVHHQRPSADVLFQSVARHVGAGAVGVLLTGMGSDGAEGLAAMRDAGGRSVVQDEATSVVWGMPGAAVRIGAADEVLALDDVAEAMLGGRPAARSGGGR